MHVHTVLLAVLMVLSSVCSYAQGEESSPTTLATEKESPLFAVYHVSMMGRWEEICQRQIERLVASGLLVDAQFQQLYVLALGPKSSFLKLEQMLEGHEDKVSVVFFSENLELFEYPSIMKVRELAYQHPDSKILYFHSKGVTRDPYVDDWAMFMEYFVLDHFDACVAKLDSYDAAGASVFQGNKFFPPHFRGNFWWASAKHVNELPIPLPDWERLQFEFFIGKRANVSFWSFHQVKIAWYGKKREPYTVDKYAGSEKRGQAFMLTNIIESSFTPPSELVFSTDLEGGLFKQFNTMLALVLKAKREGATIMVPTTRTSHLRSGNERGFLFSTFNVSAWNQTVLPPLTNMMAKATKFSSQDLWKDHKEVFSMMTEEEQELWRAFHASLVPSDYILEKASEFVLDKRFVTVHAPIEKRSKEHQEERLKLSDILNGVCEQEALKKARAGFVHVAVGTKLSEEDTEVLRSGMTPCRLPIRTTHHMRMGSYLEQAVLELEIAKRSVLFVGTPTSSFSMLLYCMRTRGLTR